MAVQEDDEYYFNDLVTFQVEDKLFKVPRREFAERSDAFANMPFGPLRKDRSNEQPFYIEGVTANDFRCFLKALFPRPMFCCDQGLTDTVLETALRLATMWDIDDFRKVLIKQFESLNLPPARKLQIARSCDIRQWYKPELRTLALRKSSLTLDEGQQLGSDLAVLVSALRDERYNTMVQEVSTGLDRKSRYVGGEVEQYTSEMEKRIDAKLVEFSRHRFWDPNDMIMVPFRRKYAQLTFE